MRLTTAFSVAVVLAAALLWAPTVRAAGATAYNRPVSWTLPIPIPGFAPCAQLPHGVTVNGDGNQHVVVQIINGVETVHSTATGSAVDSDGNEYRWVYVNHLEFNRLTGEGNFTDRFDLIGKGGALNYKVYLDWDVTIDVGTADTVPPEEILFFALTSVTENVTLGDPNCDPI